MATQMARPGSKTVIGVFIDGTMNDAAPAETEGRTNVRLMFEALRSREEAVSLYLPGVGCGSQVEMDPVSGDVPGMRAAIQALMADDVLPAKGMFGEFFGAGLTARVLAAYAFICAARRQHPEAKLWIIGFSRGAYACCVLAHFLQCAGFLVADDLGLAEDETRTVWSYDDKKVAALIRAGALNEWRLPAAREGIRVDFLGCWDTVCAVGAPERGLNRDVLLPGTASLLNGLCAKIHRWAQALNPRFIKIFLPPNVVRARHALALHEYRVAFEPMLWHQPDDAPATDVEQMWFPGAHADVGGGYQEDETSRMLSGHALHWMRQQAWPSEWEYSEPYSKRWPVHDSSQGRFASSKPEIRQALLALSEDQLPMFRKSSWLSYGLELGPQLEFCAEGGSVSTSFRPEVPALIDESHAILRSIWLRSGLLRALAPLPAEYGDPTSAEIVTALQSRRSFIAKLTTSDWMALGANPSAVTQIARLCCYDMALLGDLAPFRAIGEAAVNTAEGSAQKAAVHAAVCAVVLAPAALLFDSSRVTNAKLGLDLRL